MDEFETPAIEELELDEIAEILEELGSELSPEELRETALFVKQIGNIEDAFAAIEAAEMRKSA